MTKSNLIKGLFKLGEELDKANSIKSIMIIQDMEKLINVYVMELPIKNG